MVVQNLCTNGFLNCSQVIGQVIQGTTQYTTGSLFLSFFFVMLFIVAVALMFRVPIEYTMILILPLMLALMAHFQDFIAFGAIMIIYLSILITKNYILK